MKLSKTTARRLVSTDERVAEVMNADPTYLTERPDFSREISVLWQDVREKFLRIGRLLVRAKAVLPRGEFDAMIASDLPFNPSIAYQLRAVAAAIDTGRIGLDELPRAYSVAYQLTTLDDELLARARKAGLIRPDVRRVDVVQFKKSVLRPQADPAKIRALRFDRLRLLERLRNLEAELRELGVDPDEDDLDSGAVIEGTAEAVDD